MFIASFLLSLALAADAFAVALAHGAAVRRSPHTAAFALGGAFGVAQGIMPLLGWSLGRALGAAFEAIDHWIAFVVLGVLGARLIKEALERADDAPPRQARGWTLLALALATSIDAAAAGVTFDALGLAPFFTAAVIAAVTAALCAGGVYLGGAVGAALGRPAEFAGGCMLILLGVKVLWDHGAIPGLS